MYTFAGWVATPENRSAGLAVQRVAACLGAQRSLRPVNPLFLHGPSGTGKTHLVSALAGEVVRQCPELTCSLLPAREFAQLLPAAQNGQAGETAELVALRQSDLLVLEDLQHLPPQASAALVSLLDARSARQQQTVLTATAGPGQLRGLPVRLVSRLASGLVVGLESLAPSSRIALLQDKAQRRRLALADEVLAWLAEHAGSSVRRLEGVLAQVEALARLHGQVPDLATVTAHLGATEGLPTTAGTTVERIAERVSTYFQVEPRQIQSRSRLRHALLPRQVSMYLARQLTPLSLAQIGAYFGGRDHSTVLHACRKVEQALAHDTALSGAVRQLHADLA